MAWIAALLEIISKWLVGNKLPIGFIGHIIAGVLWTIWCLGADDMDARALLVITLPAFVINARNFVKWLREDRRE